MGLSRLYEYVKGQMMGLTLLLQDDELDRIEIAVQNELLYMQGRKYQLAQISVYMVILY